MEYSFRNYPHHHDVTVYGPPFWKTDWKVTMDLLYVKFTYLTKDNLQECSRLIATDSPCRVWNHGWSTCHLYGDLPLGLGFWLTVHVGAESCVVERNCHCFIAFIHVLYISYHFSSQMDMLWKYLRLLYSIDVVSTLSYMNAGNTCSVV